MLNIFLLNFFTKTTMGICICLGLLISGLVLGISYMLAIETSSYKCGVELFDDARNRFDVRFYIVAILFLIFDVEVAFLFSDVLQLGLTGYVGYMACDKSRFTPNSFYVANTNPVIVLEILAPTVKNWKQKSHIRNGKNFLWNSLTNRRGSILSPLIIKTVKKLQVRSYVKETSVFLYNFERWGINPKSLKFDQPGAFLRTYHKFEFKKLELVENGEVYVQYRIDKRKVPAEIELNWILQDLPHYRLETQRFWRVVEERNAQMAQYKQDMEHRLAESRSFRDKINSRFQKHITNSNSSAPDRHKEVSEEILGGFKGISEEVTSENQVAFLENVRRLDFRIFERKIELLINTYFKMDLEYDYALTYHKFLHSLHQQYELDARLGPQGTLQGVINADNDVVEMQNVLRLEPNFKWGQFNRILHETLKIYKNNQIFQDVEETVPQYSADQTVVGSREDLTLEVPVEAAVTQAGRVDTGAGTGLGFLSYLENMNFYVFLSTDIISLFYCYWGVFFSIGYVIFFWPKISLFIDYQGIKLWCKNLAWNLLMFIIHVFKSLVSTFLFEYSFFVPRIWVFIYQLIKKTGRTDW